MSNSPWSAEKVYDQVQDELQATPELTDGGALLVDESADEKASDKTAGAAKQYNGRMGKLETSQLGVQLCYVNLKVAQGFWTWIRGKLFLPETWFADDDKHKALRKKLGIPDTLRFKTKIELAWEMIESVVKRGLPFEVIAFTSTSSAQVTDSTVAANGCEEKLVLSLSKYSCYPSRLHGGSTGEHAGLSGKAEHRDPRTQKQARQGPSKAQSFEH